MNHVACCIPAAPRIFDHWWPLIRRDPSWSSTEIHCLKQLRWSVLSFQRSGGRELGLVHVHTLNSSSMVSRRCHRLILPRYLE